MINLQEKGSLSINSENILPIIKKWLYSDADIFVREMVSNCADAITKLRKLADFGEAVGIAKDEKWEIHVTLDKEAKTISFADNGVGMTANEVRDYITQIAFSGANDFLNKYSDKLDKDNEIIGHFGLGFYSAFMVADKVQIDTLSYIEGERACRWVCEGGVEYEMTDSDRADRGTTVTLYIGDDGKDFLEQYKLRSVLLKYCGFIPVDIFFHVAGETLSHDEHEHHHDHGDHDHDEHDHDHHHHDHDHDHDTPDMLDDLSAPADDIIDADEHPTGDKPVPINDTHPLWLKPANECTDEEYKEFYHKVFTDFNDPLFWIHLNMDYPFRLKGILFFPKLKHELESIEGQVKLYNNQVFIADNIKEVIPEFLLLLKGVVDCPDLPLNVSRSFLQNDGYVNKMSGYISRKVADKLNTLFKKERETYNKYWDDISPFIKYGAMKEKEFYDKIKDSVVYKTTAGDYATLQEFSDRNTSTTGKTIYYVTNEQQQAQYIKMFTDQGMQAVILAIRLDSPFISYIESYERDYKFSRIDSDISGSLKGQDEADGDEKKARTAELEQLFRTATGNDKLRVQTEALKADVSGVILLSEQSRRMQEMSQMWGGMPNLYETDETLVLNTLNPLVNALLELQTDESRKDDVYMICQQIYDLAMMSHKPLPTEQMVKFIERSNKILSRIA
ncbi:MAG: molecular chaperone HtpG [Clostridiales bacterium]|jgi:molecular chaperone HtpG|nr:molecular chaperone HtpG [Clostridiales bacterium]